MARPKIEIDSKVVEEFAKLGCTNIEIADFFDCSHDTIERRFACEIKKGKAELRMSLRRCQIETALNGNVVMLIWLGKQMLGQIERTQIDITKIPDEQLAAEAQRRLLDGTDK